MTAPSRGSSPRPLPLENSIVGPPTNLAVTPDNKLALVASSIDVVKDGDNSNAPDNKLFVIDLTASPPALIATLQIGKQPSGMAINRAGNLALVCNRAENTVSVLSIIWKDVALAPSRLHLPTHRTNCVRGGHYPDGRARAAAKAGANKVALLDIDGTTVTYKGYDMITGVFPYNVQTTADGKLALVNNNGNAGYADGQVDTVAVIDMTLDPPRVVDRVAVGDAPEGLVIRPTGGYAVSLMTNGSGGSVPNKAFFHRDNAVAVLLKIDGKTVRKLGELKSAPWLKASRSIPDRRFLFVANFGDQNVVPYRVAGNRLVPVGSPLKLPGHPASMRGSTP